MIPRIFVILFLARLCSAQSYLSGNGSLSGNGYFGGMLFTNNVDWFQSFQGGTNGVQGVVTNAMTNSAGWQSSWRSGTWSVVNALSGAGNTNLDANNTQRFMFDNTTVPPPPYTWFDVTGTNFCGSAIPFCLRYDAWSNAVPGNLSDTWEVIDWNPPGAAPSNYVAYLDFNTWIDNSAGEGSSIDILVGVSTVGSQSWSINLARGTSGSTLYCRIEVGTNAGYNIPISTNVWYRAVVKNTSASGYSSNALALYNIGNNFSLVGVSGTNSGYPTNVMTAWGHQRLGQSGHAANNNVHSKSYVWFANWGNCVTNTSSWPPVFAIQTMPQWRQHMDRYRPTLPARWQAELASVAPMRRRWGHDVDRRRELADKREWMPGETVYIREMQ